jgi:hypothetical protein
LITALSGSSTPTSTGAYTYTNTSVLALATNTTYWIVASSADATSANAFQWFYTGTGPDSGSFWTTGISKYNSGGGWNAVGFVQMFSLSVTNPIPPPISIFQPLILTYPNPGFPLVLEQNTNLNTTNWVTAANVIQLKVVDTNQAVFLVQPNGQQMFYRLH